ncbi:MAG: S-layer homology domain-containing protein [Proteobacteria bacterium]|nr:S-layer homology domain-containing protein [Pseudomonadota bacterium]
MTIRKIITVFAVICLIGVIGCGKKPVPPQAELDTPEHHVSNGHKLLTSGNTDDALREFERARDLDPEYAPAYIGIGITLGTKGDYEKGHEAMEKAEKLAKGNTQETSVHVGFMRLYTLCREKVGEKWLKKVKDHFRQAVKLSPDVSESYYYMGMAYKLNKSYDLAKAQFARVLEIQDGFVAQADQEFEIIQRIERAIPGAKIAEIALLEKISRADVAALFIEELKVDELFRNRAPKQFDASYKVPSNDFKTGEFVEVPRATDITNHVLKADIEAVMDVGIKGLQPYPDHTFQPDKMITRAEFAIMVEDILEKMSAEKNMATRNFGGSSPFPDLRNDQYYFNAVMTCTTRGIMKAKDIATGQFDPMGTISGAEAMNSIRELKIQLEKF